MLWFCLSRQAVLVLHADGALTCCAFNFSARTLAHRWSVPVELPKVAILQVGRRPRPFPEGARPSPAPALQLSACTDADAGLGRTFCNILVRMVPLVHCSHGSPRKDVAEGPLGCSVKVLKP